MHTSELITAIDAEIVRLQQARELLIGNGTATKKTGPATEFPFGVNGTGRRGKRKKRSAEARARMAAAQKARWARVRQSKTEKK